MTQSHIHQCAASVTHQGGVVEGDDDVGVQLVLLRPLERPHGGRGAWQRPHCEFCHCEAGPEHAQRGAGAPPAGGIDLRRLLVQQVRHLRTNRHGHLLGLVVGPGIGAVAAGLTDGLYPETVAAQLSNMGAGLRIAMLMPQTSMG